MLTVEPPATFTSPAPKRATARGASFWVLVVLVAILCLVGVVMVLSASSIVSMHQFGSPWHFNPASW